MAMPNLKFDEVDITIRGLAGLEGSDVVRLYRSKVPGGWLMMLADTALGVPTHAGGLVFISDPSHAWDGSSFP